MHRLVIALTTLLALTGVAFVAAQLLLFSHTADAAAELAPADTALYVTISLQPSAGQEMNIAELAGRLPGFGDSSTLDAKIDEVVQNLLSLAGLDYGTDVRPWLGDQVALAIPGDADMSAPTVIVLAAVRDAEAARASLAGIEERSGAQYESSTHEGVEIRAGGATAYALVGEMLVAADDADRVRAIVDVANGAPSLAGSAAFRDLMATLEMDRVAAVYADLEALAPGLAGVNRHAAAALVVEEDGLVVSGRAPVPSATASSQPSAAPTLTSWMPPDTQVAVSSFDGARLITSAEGVLSLLPQLSDLAGTLQAVRALFTFALGMDLDATLAQLLDGEAALALSGLDGDAPSGALLLRPRDLAAAVDSLEQVIEGLEGAGASVEREQRAGAEVVTAGLADFGALSYATVDDVVIIGVGSDAVEAALTAHEGGDSLSATDRYARALALAGPRGGTEIFVEIEILLVAAGLSDGLPGDARDILEQLSGLVVTLPDRGDHIEIRAALTVE